MTLLTRLPGGIDGVSPARVLRRLLTVLALLSAGLLVPRLIALARLTAGLLVPWLRVLRCLAAVRRRRG